MPTYHTKALVLRKTKLGETDLIITLLSEEGRQLRAVAKGARKPASRFSASLELYSVADLLLYTGRTLDTVTEAHVIESHAPCRIDLEHSSAASVLTEMLAKVTVDGVEEPVLFPFATTALAAYGAVPFQRLPLLVAASLLKTASILGLRPALGHCASCGAETEGAAFSMTAGGMLCANCADHGVLGGADPWPPETLRWAALLIASTFSELAALAFDDAAAEQELGMDMLRFAKAWTDIHLAVRLKSLDFFLASGLF